MKCAQWVNPQTQKVDWWGQGRGLGDWECVLGAVGLLCGEETFGIDRSTAEGEEACARMAKTPLPLCLQLFGLFWFRPYSLPRTPSPHLLAPHLPTSPC